METIFFWDLNPRLQHIMNEMLKTLKLSKSISVDCLGRVFESRLLSEATSCSFESSWGQTVSKVSNAHKNKFMPICFMKVCQFS